MKYAIKSYVVLLFLIIIASSCSEDKGNYDYNWLPDLAIDLPVNDSIIVKLGERLVIEPVFLNSETGKTEEVNHDDYIYRWTWLDASETGTSRMKLLSDKYNLDKDIQLEISSDYHQITLHATHKETGMIYNSSFRIKVIGSFSSAYLFLIEDEQKNSDLEVYGKDGEGNRVWLHNYLSGVEFTFRSGEAHTISYDGPQKRIWISTSSGTGWLASPDFKFEPLTNILSTALIPQSTTTFTKMIRTGEASTRVAYRQIFCFDGKGDLYTIQNTTGIKQSIAHTANYEKLVIAPMIGVGNAHRAAILWDKLKKRFVWINALNKAGASLSSYCMPLETGVIDNLEECIYLGGSRNLTSKEMIAVAKDKNGVYWKSDFISAQQTPPFGAYAPKLIKGPHRLLNTETMGNIGHWLSSLEKGYLYMTVEKDLYTYIEDATGVGTDKGWTKVEITDSENKVITISDPISLMHTEDYGFGNTKMYFYVITYSPENGSTVYVLNPRSTSDKVELIEKISVNGNIKSMTYWWG